MRNVNFNRIDMINVLSAAQDIKATTNQNLTVTGVYTYEDTDKETGEIKTVGAIKTADGMIFGFTSSTLLECAERIADALSEDDVSEVDIKTISRESKAGRTFYQFVVTDIR